MKMKYSKIIEEAAHANFAVPDIWTALSGEFSTGSIDSISSIQIYEDGVKIPRYYPFTQIFPQILENPANTIKFIAGNTHIVSEFLQTEYSKDAFIELSIPIQPDIIRAFYYTNIDELQFLIADKTKTLKHIYDY